MRVMKIIYLMLMGWPLSASAYSCLDMGSQYFLNTVAQTPGCPYVAIPENAKGILFYSNVYLHDVDDIKTGKLVVKSVPPALTADQFAIVELEKGRSIRAIVTRLNVDRQIGMRGNARFHRARYMGIFNSFQDVTAEIKKANGLFRVGPADGFRSGHRYQMTYRPHGLAQKSLQIEVRIGPPIVLSSAGNYSLRLEGSSCRK